MIPDAELNFVQIFTGLLVAYAQLWAVWSLHIVLPAALLEHYLL